MTGAKGGEKKRAYTIFPSQERTVKEGHDIEVHQINVSLPALSTGALFETVNPLS